jgi:putative DNA primase/helicase
MNADEKKKLEEMRQAVEARVREEEELYPEIFEKLKHDGKIDSVFVRWCMGANERGLGLLYAAVLRDRFVFNYLADEKSGWMRWAGHHWEIDMAHESLAAVEDVVDRLLAETIEIEKDIAAAAKFNNEDKMAILEKIKKKLYGKAGYLRSTKGRNACLQFARTCGETSLSIRGDELDVNPWLLGCPNGVLDLRSGKFRDGRQSDNISKTCNVEWRGIDEPAPHWEEWLKQVFDNDNPDEEERIKQRDELIAFVQRVFGYGIAGLNIEHIFVVLHGQGRNGKDTFVNIISHVLGTMAGTIQSEMLLSSKNTKSSAGPSPDVMGLKGLRLAFASETDEGQRFSPAKVKWYTGGGQLVGRHPHDKYEVRFMPTHTLILLTNHKPGTPTDDFAFWERVHLIPFKLSFVDRDPVGPNERRVIKGVSQTLKEEGPGILAWLVMGCLLYQRDGLKPPKVVIEATSDWRRDDDLLADFLEECCEEVELNEESSADLYARYAKWYQKNINSDEKKTPKNKRFGSALAKKYMSFKTHGVVFYKGIKLKEENNTTDDPSKSGEDHYKKQSRLL